MIDHFLGDDFGVLSGPYWSIVLQCGAQMPIVSGAQFLTGGVFE